MANYPDTFHHKDAIDLDRLRHDPLMKLAVGRCPDSGAALASQSCFLSDISGWSLSLVGSAPRRQATERPAGAACWPPSPIPFSRMPDRGDGGSPGTSRAS